MMQEQPVVIDAILKLKGQTIVAVDGPSASGKSTFAQALADAAGQATVIHLDDFYRPMAPEERKALTPEQGADLYFDVDRLITQALSPLHSGHSAHFQVYDWSTNQLGEWREVAPAELIIMEGVHAADQRCRPLLDVIVFVVTTPQIRWDRILDRGHHDLEQIRRWLAAEDWYFSEHALPETADFVVPGHTS